MIHIGALMQTTYHNTMVREKGFVPSARRSRLSNVNVLLVDADERMVSLLRKVLTSLGFGAIYTAKNGHDAVQQLHAKSIDLVITDWDMRPVNGIEFTQFIRCNRLSPNRQIPIIMLTGKAKREHVEEARDQGVTEFLVKPFTVRALCDRILLVIETPRSFILNSTYTGPDRRRRQLSLQGKADRRQENSANCQVLARHDNITVIRKNDQEITIVDADVSMRDKVGEHISFDDIFNIENVARAQRIIHQSRGQYLDWVVQDLRMLHEAFQAIEVNAKHSQQDVEKVEAIALHIKSQAGVFDYTLASQVAESLYDICFNRASLSSSACMTGRKHIDALYVIFQRNIQGAGGVVGDELRNNLRALVELIHP